MEDPGKKPCTGKSDCDCPDCYELHEQDRVRRGDGDDAEVERREVEEFEREHRVDEIVRRRMG